MRGRHFHYNDILRYGIVGFFLLLFLLSCCTPIHADWAKVENIPGSGCSQGYDPLSMPDDGCTTYPGPVAIIDLISPTPAIVEEIVMFIGNGSTSSGTITHWQWRSSIDGIFSNEKICYCSSLTQGNHQIFLKIQNSFDEWSEEAEASLLIHCRPVADAAGPYFGYVHEELFFDGSASYDPEGSALTYLWDFGDGTDESGVSPSHVYEESGVYTAVLTVADEYHAVHQAQTEVTIVDSSPVADAGGPYSGVVNQLLCFSGLGSFDIEGDIVSYQWDFDDGESGNGATITHTYSEAALYFVSLTVVDEDGNQDSDIAEVMISHDNIPPTQPQVTGPTRGIPRVSYSFQMMATDEEGQEICFVIDWGDGSSTTTPFFPAGAVITTSHLWDESGEYNVSIIARDAQSAASIPYEQDMICMIDESSDNGSLLLPGQNPDVSAGVIQDILPVFSVVLFCVGFGLSIICIQGAKKFYQKASRRYYQ